ncbi:MAG: transcriptional repressor [Desulfobacterales bacterium]
MTEWVIFHKNIDRIVEITYRTRGNNLLQPKNIRMTRQRKIILEELQKQKTHPSADEIYQMVRRRIPRISLGTVYRNLEVLVNMGEIQKLELSGALKRYDWDTNKHYHIRCVRCDRVDDAPIAPLNQLENELYGATVFEIIGHNLEFTGLCPECSKKEALNHAK